MKKIFLVLILVLTVSVGSVFADHPSSFGIGGGWQYYGGSWTKGNGLDSGSQFSLFLKAPAIPIYWGVTLDAMHLSDYIGIGVTGDKFLFDNTLVPNINLGWFLGLGGYGSLVLGDWGMFVGAGARLPVGLYIMPIKNLEIFLDIAPSIGIHIALPKNGDADFGLGGGWGADLGIRYWF